MTDNSKGAMESLKRLFKQLKEENIKLQEKCTLLEENISTLENTLQAKSSEIQKLSLESAQSETRYKNLQASQKAELTSQQLRENKERYAKLVREIDKCIAILNE